MKTIVVRGASKDSQILVGESIDHLQQYIESRRAVIITDTTVKRLYRKRFPDCPIITIGLSEKIKTLDTVSAIFDQLIQLEADRSTFIIGIGGGIVCDITGFVASTYMRGIRFGFVATTLLAQVDASVGGKNGVNFGGYKNMVGTFNQPELVICDMALLKTLPVGETLCGFAEIIKHGAIADKRILDYLETHRIAALDMDAATIAHLVHRSVEIKAGVVTRDEHEHGVRRQLNFGHTFGHAIEKLAGIPHGEAVGIGMALAAQLSVQKNRLSPTEAKRLERLIVSYGLPVQSPVDLLSIFSAMKKDKKREGAKIHFVCLDALGSACIEAVSFDELFQLIKTVGTG